MSEAVGEEQARQLIAAYQQYQAEYEAVVREMNLTQMAAQGLDNAVAAVESIENSKVDQEILVPIGSGSYAYARISVVDRILLNVGAGVSIEKPTGEAIETLKARKNEVSEGSRKLSEIMTKLQREMGAIQSVLERYEQQAAGSE